MIKNILKNSNLLIILLLIISISSSCIEGPLSDSSTEPNEEGNDPVSFDKPEFNYYVIYNAVDSIYNLIHQNASSNLSIPYHGSEYGFSYAIHGEDTKESVLGWNNDEGELDYNNKWHWYFFPSADLDMELTAAKAATLPEMIQWEIYLTGTACNVSKSNYLIYQAVISSDGKRGSAVTDSPYGSTADAPVNYICCTCYSGRRDPITDVSWLIENGEISYQVKSRTFIDKHDHIKSANFYANQLGGNFTVESYSYVKSSGYYMHHTVQYSWDTNTVNVYYESYDINGEIYNHEYQWQYN